MITYGVNVDDVIMDNYITESKTSFELIKKPLNRFLSHLQKFEWTSQLKESLLFHKSLEKFNITLLVGYYNTYCIKLFSI